MGFLTERERDILRWLREGLAVKEIGRRLGVSDTSVSRSISNIRVKAGDLADDVEFLAGIGFLRVKGGRVECRPLILGRTADSGRRAIEDFLHAENVCLHIADKSLLLGRVSTKTVHLG